MVKTKRDVAEVVFKGVFSVFNKVIVLILSLLMVACSSLSKNSHNTSVSKKKTSNDSHNEESQIKGDSSIPLNLDSKSRADYHFTLSEIYSASSNITKSIEELKKTLVYDPKAVLVHLKLAKLYLRSGDITKSIASANTVLEIDPKNNEATIFIGTIYMSLGIYKQAEEQYRQTLSHYSTNDKETFELSLQLALTIIQQKEKEEEAIKILQNLIKNSDQHKHIAYYYLGHIQQMKQNLIKAEKYYKESLKVKEDFKKAAISLAKLYEQTNKPLDAINLLQSFNKKFGPNEQVALYLSRIYLYQKDYNNAYMQYEIISAFNPSNVELQTRMAFILIKQKKYEEALNKLQDVLNQKPQAVARIHFYIGAIYEEMEKYPEAVKAFLKVPTSSSYYDESRIYAAYLENKQERSQKAIQILKDAIASSPQNPKLFTVYASLLNDAQQYDKAITLLNSVIKKFPQEEQLHFLLGSLHDKVGNKEETIKVMKYILSLNPQHVEALNYLAYTYAEMDKQLDEAEALARQAIKLKPNDGYIQDTLGWVIFKKGQITDSIKLLESAYKIESDESIIAEHLGDAYYKNNLLSKALEMYKKAYEIETGRKEKDKLQSKIKAITDAVEERIPASSHKRSSNP